MGIDYTLMASVLIYIEVVRLFDRYTLEIIVCALAVAIGPLLLNLILGVILTSGYHLSFSNIFGGTGLLVVVVQVLAAIGIFYELRKNEDNMDGWFAWAIVGGFVLFLAVPYAVNALVQL